MRARARPKSLMRARARPESLMRARARPESLMRAVSAGSRWCGLMIPGGDADAGRPSRTDAHRTTPVPHRSPPS
jgi:hypothetical protein